jgi:hypothetical protein
MEYGNHTASGQLRHDISIWAIQCRHDSTNAVSAEWTYPRHDHQSDGGHSTGGVLHVLGQLLPDDHFTLFGETGA